MSSPATESAVAGQAPAALVEVRIRDLGVITDATLRFGRGLTVLTGETGAGKTMVVTAVSLLFGGRADASRVRPGASQATVDGRLQLPPDHPAVGRVISAGGELDEDGSVTIRRTVSPAGRSRAFVGGAGVPVAVLAEVGATVVAVHGQTDQLRLARPAEQRAAVDRFAAAHDREFSRLLGDYADAYARWQTLTTDLRQRRARSRELRREAELLRHGLAQIDAADLADDEDLDLAGREARLARLDALRLAARTAHDAVLGDPDEPASAAADAVSLLGAARRVLEQAAGSSDAGAAVEPVAAQLANRTAELGSAAADLGADLSSFLADLEAEGADPQALAQLQQRRQLVTGLIRSYGDPESGEASAVPSVRRWATDAQHRLAQVDVSDETLQAIAAELAKAATAAAAAATALSAARTAAARTLAEAMTAELNALAMPAAVVTVAVRPRLAADDSAAAILQVHGAGVLATADGTDEVTILLSSHPDSPPLPVHRGASGGELSRVMLAIEAVLAATEPVPLLVFDEVDAGLGGRAAVQVGARLARLAKHHQVLVVTHLAQVAAAGHSQIAVSRDVGDQIRAADVTLLTGAPRLAELARMLSGKDTPTARQHAAELLEHAR